MPQTSKLIKALQIIQRTDTFTSMDDITSTLQNLIDDGEYVKDWTAQDIAEFVLEVVAL